MHKTTLTRQFMLAFALSALLGGCRQEVAVASASHSTSKGDAKATWLEISTAGGRCDTAIQYMKEDMQHGVTDGQMTPEEAATSISAARTASTICHGSALAIAEITTQATCVQAYSMKAKVADTVAQGLEAGEFFARARDEARGVNDALRKCKAAFAQG